VQPFRISVIVRARNEAPSIGRCLELVLGQDLPGGEVELIVVDNESSDQTAAIAHAQGATVLELPAARFSFGRALNLGARHARGEIMVALSAHAFPRDRGWLMRLAAAFEDPLVACACGERFRPDGSPLAQPVALNAAMSAADPDWGYSNAAGAFRASLWRERPFREDLPACEDKEWAGFWLGRGFVCRLDPALSVEHDHTHDPVLEIYRRARRESAGFSMYLPGSGRVPTLRRLVREWWSDTRFYTSHWRARLSHRRAARLLGAFAGARSGARQG
jgi:rhamnosyltransferase